MMRDGRDDSSHPVEAGARAATDRYRAPALEKGLDIIALLVGAKAPMTMNEICHALGRSQGEIFRMVQVLQTRAFIEQDPSSDGYRLTDMLFTMAMRQPPIQSLVELALPQMRQLAVELGQSCHLTFHSQGDIVVVARMESDEQIGFSVRVGHRLRLIRTVSGAVICAFQPQDVQERWISAGQQDCSAEEVDAFRQRFAEARTKGFALAPSSFVSGITDISAPIIRGDRAAAALTVPFISHANLRLPMSAAAEHLVASAREISALLLPSDSRV